MPRKNSSEIIFETIAIIGVGLIGGSLGMAAKKHRLARKVIGIGRMEQKLMRAKILGAIDDYSFDMETGASDADLVIICTPVRLVVPTLARIIGRLKEGSIVTDVGSTKAEIVSEANKIMPERRFFVGGHPMAGSEQSGVEAAFPEMFLGATYVLTADGHTNLEALGKMTEFVEAIGARSEIMSPEEHDAAVAVISHLPHAIAAALLHTAEEAHRQSGKVFRLAAGSFRDLTRVSDSPPELWRDICLTNVDPLIAVIDQFQDQLAQFKQRLAQRDEEAVAKFFEQAKHIRDSYSRIAK
jgi:prephenate dehydrogenase